MRRQFFYTLYIFSCISISAIAQETPSENQPLDLLEEISIAKTDSLQLLPKKYPLTQKLFWGEKGLMRNFNQFELTPEKRQAELNLRRKMLIAHQTLGFATLGAMIAQGIVGSQLYKGNYAIKDLHEGLAGAVNIGYFSTAGLALLTPPKATDENKGYSSIKTHKALAYIHFSSMVLTNILADKASDPKYKPYHRAAAYSAFGSFAAAMIIIKF